VQQGRQPVHSARASGETSPNDIPAGQLGQIPGKQLGQSGEVARRLGRISHNGSPGYAAVAMVTVCQRGALNRTRAADPGAVG